MGKFEDYLEELRDKYELEDEDIQKLSDASGPRNDAREAKKEAERLKAEVEELKTYREIAVENKFKELGIKVSPKALNLPADLKLSDDEAVKNWASENGLIEVPVNPNEESIANHESIATTATGAEPASGLISAATVQQWPAAKIIRFGRDFPDEMEELKRNPESWKMKAPAGF